MSGQRITLRIGRIVLDGSRGSTQEIAVAVERELGRLLARPGAADALRGGGAVPRLDGGRLETGSNRGAALGRSIARATIGALRK